MNPTWIYVAAVYAIGVWIARRAGAALPWRVALFFYALVLIFFFRPMTQAYVNVPVDYIDSIPPWAYIERHPHSSNSQMNDVPLQMLPWAHEVRESWRSFRVPLWNARAGSGYPLLANGQSGALSLLRILGLPLSLGHSFTAEAAMKVLIAATFTFLLCRRRRYSELASAIGAASFGFCSFLLVWLHFPHSSVACFLAPFFLAIDQLAERVTYGRVVFAAAVWTLLLFAGHPETAAHIFFLSVLFAGWILLVERPWPTWRDALRFAAALFGAFALAAILASPFLVPLAEALRKSQRFQLLSVWGSQESPFVESMSQVLLFQPHFYGDVPFERPWGPAVAESITGFAGILGVAGWFALLFDAIAVRRFRTREMFLVAATPIVLGVILGWPVIGPLFNKALAMAANARVRLLLCFLVSLQAAALVDLIERGRRRVCLASLLLVSGAFLALVTLTRFDKPWQRDGALLAILPSLVVLAAATLSTSVSRRFRPVALMLLLALVVAEVWRATGAWNPVLPERKLYPRTPLIKSLEAFRDAAPPASFRILGVNSIFFPNLSTIFGIDDVRGHDPMVNGRYFGLLRVLTGYTADNYFAMWDNIETRLLDYLNVRYIVTPPQADFADRERFQLVYDGPDGQLWENHDALPRFFSTPIVILESRTDAFVRRLREQGDWKGVAVIKHLPALSDRERTDLLAPRPAGSKETSLRIVSSADTRYALHVDAPRHSLVVSSIPSWPGWRVTVAGRSVQPLQVNGAFLGFLVPPGASEVDVRYAPLSFWLPAGVALLTLAAIAVLSRESLRHRLSAAVRRG